MALPHDATGLSAVCDCGISRSYPLTIFGKQGPCYIVHTYKGTAGGHFCGHLGNRFLSKLTFELGRKIDKKNAYIKFEKKISLQMANRVCKCKQTGGSHFGRYLNLGMIMIKVMHI